MTQYSSSLGRSSVQRRWSSAAWVRVALAAGLLCLAAPPVLVMGMTAAKFEEIYREFGVKLSPLQMTLLGLGRLLESPAAMLGALVLLGAFCFAAALSCIPFGAVAPADGAGVRPRWKRTITAAAAIAFVSFALIVAYVGTMVGTMQTVIGKLESKPPASTVQPAPR